MLDTSKFKIVRGSLKNITIFIEPTGEVIVKAPRFIPRFVIDQFISKHSKWIEKKLNNVMSKPAVNLSKDEYLYLGKKLLFTSSDTLEIKVKEDKLLFPKALLFRKEKELTRWYISESRGIISKQLEKYSKEMKTSYYSFSLSDTSSKWGSCTWDNRLQFNWRVVMAPILVISYVVVHELAHTIEKNHTQMFWMKVRNVNPSYRQQRQWLKDHGHVLKIVV